MCFGGGVDNGWLSRVLLVFKPITYRWDDGHESKPAISILAIVEKSQQTSNFCYFATYSIHVLT